MISTFEKHQKGHFSPAPPKLFSEGRDDLGYLKNAKTTFLDDLGFLKNVKTHFSTI
jgi:hypothetical protein